MPIAKICHDADQYRSCQVFVYTISPTTTTPIQSPLTTPTPAQLPAVAVSTGHIVHIYLGGNQIFEFPASSQIKIVFQKMDFIFIFYKSSAFKYRSSASGYVSS
jgi:hypothetical protein